MANMFLLGMAAPVEVEESQVRSTVQPVRHSDPAELTHPPDWNEFNADDNGDLTGLSPRQLSSDTIESVQHAPFDIDLSTQNHNAIIDNQVATSGTAAQREAAGERGHGTMQYALGIEPVIREGAAFGSDMFLAFDRGANEDAGMYMTPDGTNNSWASFAAAEAAERSSRQAAQNGMYAAFLEAVTR